MGRLMGGLMAWLGFGLAQAVVWLQPGQETVLRLPPQGSLLELWAPYTYTLEGSYEARATDRQLRLVGSGPGRLLLGLAGQEYTLRMVASPLGYTQYQLRPAAASLRPPAPLPAGLLPQLFWVGPGQLGYSLLNLSQETLQLDPALLELTLNGQRLTPGLERHTNASILGVLPPLTAEYGLITLPTTQPLRWRWLLLGNRQPYLWEGTP